MIELIEKVPEGVLGFTAIGKVTGEDYQRVVVPAVERALTRAPALRVIYHLGPRFESFEAAAIWDDARVGLGHLAAWERIAVVSDHEWIRNSVRALGFLMPCPVRVFAEADFAPACSWIEEPSPDGLQVDYLPESAVVRLTVIGSLRAEDFQRAARRIDPLLEGQGELRGLMVRTRGLPRWAGFAGLASHLRFVREHHARVRRVAFVSDQPVVSFFPSLARHFVSAELRHFPASAEDAALDWLGSGD